MLSGARCRCSRSSPSGFPAVADDAAARRRANHIRALAIPNYRRYFAGQSISLIGTWMQMAAQSWLVLTLTHSAPTLG